MTVEELKEQVANLRTQEENAMATVYMARGAIQLAEELIRKLEVADKEAE